MSMFRVPGHIWRTQDGRLVRHGHPDAAVLAYATGMEVAGVEAERLRLADVYAEVKQQAKPADKMAARAADKSYVPSVRKGA